MAKEMDWPEIRFRSSPNNKEKFETILKARGIKAWQWFEEYMKSQGFVDEAEKLQTQGKIEIVSKTGKEDRMLPSLMSEESAKKLFEEVKE